MNDTPKKRGRPAKIHQEETPDIQQQIVEGIREVFVERIIRLPEERLSGYALYKKLAQTGFPQGGGGTIVLNEEGTDSAYIPRPEELYNSFIGNAEHWQVLIDSLARAWIENSEK